MPHTRSYCPITVHYATKSSKLHKNAGFSKKKIYNAVLYNIFLVKKITFQFSKRYLQHCCKLAVAVTDHVPMPDPGSEHVLVSAVVGMRPLLHEYMKESPARNWSVRAVTGMVTALAWAGTGVSQTTQNYKSRDRRIHYVQNNHKQTNKFGWYFSTIIFSTSGKSYDYPL